MTYFGTPVVEQWYEINLTARDLRQPFGHPSRAGGASKDDRADVLGNSAAADRRLQRTYMAPQFGAAMRVIHAVRRPADDQTASTGRGRKS
ncbi:hypothetical protein [Rhodovulum sp. P5]|uniref:hypothetical protein n=1 Tax=Rhodovulum sp. P5 TaxID=1564506 RepID=UPI0012EBEA3A|nr:hypothetical protein [Rhodovulum sp. P5]